MVLVILTNMGVKYFVVFPILTVDKTREKWYNNKAVRKKGASEISEKKFRKNFKKAIDKHSMLCYNGKASPKKAANRSLKIEQQEESTSIEHGEIHVLCENGTRRFWENTTQKQVKEQSSSD